MDELDRRIRRMIDDRLETTIQRQLDIFVDQVMEMIAYTYRESKWELLP